jgi:hypothetical protein
MTRPAHDKREVSTKLEADSKPSKRLSMNANSGLVILAVGLVFVAFGLLVWSGALSWFGKLPGDIRIERPGLSVYAPITSMILVSIVISVALAVYRGISR